MTDTIAGLLAAVEQADSMIDKRRSGRSWSDITTSAPNPMITEILTHALEDLGEVGSRYRHEKAVALRREGLSTRSIGELFGVSRQRVSTLLRQRR
ncbi:hypothetical protein [Pseudonocardia sp. DLS-67]